MNKFIQYKKKVSKNKIKGQITLLLLFFLFINSLGASANSIDKTEMTTLSQIIKTKTVTLNEKNKPIREILNTIQKQTGISFSFKEGLKPEEMGRFSISVTNTTVEAALKKLFEATNFTYSIVNNVIVISMKEVVKESTTKAKEMVNGAVKDQLNKPVVGATVIISGTSDGVITDENGRFAVKASAGTKLEVSFTGMKDIVYTVKGDETNLVLKMLQDVLEVNDVVVTGFNDIKKSSYTGNAVTVKRDDILKVSKTNVIKALQTFDPSFRIKENNRWGSDPNALPEVNIRGGSSLGVEQARFGADGLLVERMDMRKSNLKDNPNLPTFIMDGFEIDIRKLYDFDPNRIESITILKDATATAMYGSRAANGVVIITTVIPKPGKLNIDYNFVSEISAPDLSDYNLLNAAEKLETERLANCFIQDDAMGMYDQFGLDQEYNAKLANVRKGVDTYWLSQPLRTSFNHKHGLTIDGGSENLRFGMDMEYSSKNGVMKGSKRDNLGAGFYINYTFKTLSIRNYTSFTMIDSEESPYGNYSTFTKQQPYDRFTDDDGKVLPGLFNWQSFYDPSARPRVNPMYEPSLHNFDKQNEQNITNNLSVIWKLRPELLFKAQFSVQKEDSKDEVFYDPNSLKNSKPLSESVLSSGQLEQEFSNGFRVELNTTLSYFKAIQKHTINALAGFNLRNYKSEGHYARYEGFPSGVLNSPNYARIQTDKNKFNDETTRGVGFLASLNYSFDDIYLLDASIRIDGSSQFGANKRFAPFWSTGLGINIHKYNFMKDSRVFSELKIRGSYGQTGNARFSAYESLVTYDILTDDWYKTGYGSTLKAYGNKNLKWETTNTLDVGFEMSLFKGLLYLKGSYYDKNTVDVINNVTIPASTGFTTYKDNVGEVSNKGFEIDLRVSAFRTENMALYVTANLASNKSKIQKISESMKAYNKKVQDMFELESRFKPNVTAPLIQYQEGQPLNSIWGMQSLGINPANGKEVFRRRNGTLTETWNTREQVILGYTDPKAQGAIGLNFTYKQFSIYTSFSYQFGGQMFNQTLMDKVENASIYNDNVDHRVMTERWKKPGDISKYKAITVGKNNLELTKPSSRFVQDYNVLSMNSVEVSYDFPRQITQKLHLGVLRLTAGMNDVFHLSSIEQERGLDYPFARTVNFSLRIAF